MAQETLLLLLADLILIIHVLFVCFVVFGLVAIYLGLGFHWTWVRNSVFRIAHLLAIGLVVIESWLGVNCPLTTWEMTLREAAGSSSYAGSFIQFWLHKLLFFRAPDWLFMVIYTGFGALVLASWFVVRPHKHS